MHGAQDRREDGPEHRSTGEAGGRQPCDPEFALHARDEAEERDPEHDHHEADHDLDGVARAAAACRPILAAITLTSVKMAVKPAMNSSVPATIRPRTR